MFLGRLSLSFEAQERAKRTEDRGKYPSLGEAYISNKHLGLEESDLGGLMVRAIEPTGKIRNDYRRCS